MQSIYDKMTLPKSAAINRVISKALMFNNTDLNTADRKLFDNVEKIYWRYALKTETCHIQANSDYPEIEIIEVNMRKIKSIPRLAEIIMRAIPYPMLLFIVHEQRVQLYTGIIRENLVDSTKITIEEMQTTDWLAVDDDFWEKLSLSKQHTANFAMLYHDYYDIISKQRLMIKTDIKEQKPISGDEARAKLQQLAEIDNKLAMLRSQLKKTTQFNRKVELNIKIQKLKRERQAMI